MNDERITFSNKYTGKILSIYNGGEWSGLCYYEINEELLEKIKIMRDLGIVGSGHIQGFYSVQAIIKESTKAVFFVPNLDPAYLTTDKIFFDSHYNKGHVLWHVKSMNFKGIDNTIVIHSEGLFIEVMTECFFIRAVPVENIFITNEIFTQKISFDSIK